MKTSETNPYLKHFKTAVTATSLPIRFENAKEKIDQHRCWFHIQNSVARVTSSHEPDLSAVLTEDSQSKDLIRSMLS
jgi:hypothetical protein